MGLRLANQLTTLVFLTIRGKHKHSTVVYHSQWEPQKHPQQKDEPFSAYCRIRFCRNTAEVDR